MLVLALALLGYNLARHDIFWRNTEDVTIPSGDVRLAGTLVKPARNGVFPAVVVLHGSGPEPRSEISYHIQAKALLRAGFAVLIYDKRGTGESSGDFDSAGYEDFVRDAVAATELLANRPDIDADCIGLHGNSESGWLTPEIAVRSGHVRFIFNRVGPPLSWMDTVSWEVRNDSLAIGVPEADVDRVVDFTRRRWEYLIAAAADPELAAGPRREALEAELADLRETVPGADEALPEHIRPYDADEYRAAAADIGYDPRPYLEQLELPMYYAFAENDINVPTRDSVAALEALRDEAGKNIEFTVFPGVGHAMANWTGLFNAGYIPGYMELLRTWPAAQCASRGDAS